MIVSCVCTGSPTLGVGPGRLRDWREGHGHERVELRGRLSQCPVPDPAALERANYIKNLLMAATIAAGSGLDAVIGCRDGSASDPSCPIRLVAAEMLASEQMKVGTIKKYPMVLKRRQFGRYRTLPCVNGKARKQRS
jgi:hypothetical protein